MAFLRQCLQELRVRQGDQTTQVSLTSKPDVPTFQTASACLDLPRTSATPSSHSCSIQNRPEDMRLHIEAGDPGLDFQGWKS